MLFSNLLPNETETTQGTFSTNPKTAGAITLTVQAQAGTIEAKLWTS